jgi:hypothetical protein
MIIIGSSRRDLAPRIQKHHLQICNKAHGGEKLPCTSNWYAVITRGYYHAVVLECSELLVNLVFFFLHKFYEDIKCKKVVVWETSIKLILSNPPGKNPTLLKPESNQTLHILMS